MTFTDWQTWVFLGAVGFVAYDHFKLSGALASTRVDLERLRTHVAETYVRSPELQRVSDDVAALRHSVEEAVKLLHEIKGAQATTRG